MAHRSTVERVRSVARRYFDSIFELVHLQRELVTFLEHQSWERGLESPRYADAKRLTRFGYKAFSESDEDGIIAEIFRRVGVENGIFFEFGVGNGLANNTLNLLMGGWRGYWIDGSAEYVKRIELEFADYLQDRRLRMLNAYITKDSINGLIQQMGIPRSVDLLSIDIDGNDYWIWKAVELSARVVVIEYNATLHPPLSLVMPYADQNQWNGTNYFGASLTALEKLGREKGYCLVGCNYTGVNAFFVREDLVGSLFAAPFTAENHYEPARYLKLRAGHRSGVGPYEQVQEFALPTIALK